MPTPSYPDGLHSSQSGYFWLVKDENEDTWATTGNEEASLAICRLAGLDKVAGDLIDGWDALNSTNKSGVLTMLNSTNKSGVLTIWPGLEGIIEYARTKRIRGSTETLIAGPGIGDGKPGDTRQDPPGEPEYPTQSGQSNAISGVNISSPLPNASISGNVSPPTLTAPHPIERTRPSTHGEQSAKQFPAERAIPRDPDPDPAFRQQVHSVPNVPSFPCLSEGPDHLNKVIGILAEWAEMQIRVRTSLTGGSDADRSVSRFPPSI